MNSPRTLTALTTLAGMAALGLLSAPRALSQSVSVEVTATKQQTFQGFGAAFSGIPGTFAPTGGRTGPTANALYDLLLTPNSPGSLNLTYLRLSLDADVYKSSPTAPYDFASAVVKTGAADVITAAKRRNPNLKLFYSNWTPPYWMKENGADYDIHLGTPGDPYPPHPDVDAKTTNHLLASQQANYAALLGHFCTDFNAYFKFPVDALSFQNEPDVNVSYGCCLYPDTHSVDSQASLYLSMLTALRRVQPFSRWGAPQIWGPECTNAGNLSYVSAAANRGLLSALCTHSYGGGASEIPLNQRNSLPCHMTEYSSTDSGPYASKVNGAVSQPLMAAQMADQFCKDVNDGQVASWFWWNLVGVNFAGGSPTDTGQSLILANAAYAPNSVYTYIDQTAFPADHALIALDNNALYPVGGSYETPYKAEFGPNWTLTSKYYAFRRLTQAVVPNSVSLRTQTSPSDVSGTPQDDVYAAGFLLPSGKYCLVIANQSGKAYQVNLKVDGLTSTPWTGYTVYYTSQDTSGDPINDVSWNDVLTNGQETTTAWPYSVTCYVPK